MIEWKKQWMKRHYSQRGPNSVQCPFGLHWALQPTPVPVSMFVFMVVPETVSVPAPEHDDSPVDASPRAGKRLDLMPGKP